MINYNIIIIIDIHLHYLVQLLRFICFVKLFLSQIHNGLEKVLFIENYFYENLINVFSFHFRRILLRSKWTLWYTILKSCTYSFNCQSKKIIQFSCNEFIGPPLWTGTCSTGLRQSPINIHIPKVSVYKRWTYFTFNQAYSNSHSSFFARNTGHSCM